MKNDGFIYHHTSIETLALILNTRTIRFNNLGDVSDMGEVETQESVDIGKYCLVSCWTKSSRESIPLWNMYTPNMKGVRIGLPSTVDIFDKNFDPNDKDIKKENGFFPLYSTSPYPELVDIVYEDTIRKLHTKNSLNGLSHLSGDALGRSKSTDWSFENECRFRLFLVPHENKSRFANLTDFDYMLKSNKWKIKTPKQVCDFLLRSDVISEMEILLGPKTTRSERIIVETLAEKYGIAKKQVSKSKLRIR